MVLTPEEIKVVKSMLAPAVQNGLIDAKHLSELLLLASGGESRPEAKLNALFTIRETAELLHCHPKSVWRFIREKRLECVYLGPKSARVPAESIKNFPQHDNSKTVQ